MRQYFVRLLPCMLAVCLSPAGCATQAHENAGGRATQPEIGRSVSIAPDVEVSALAPGVWLHTSWYTYPGGTRVSSNGLIVREGDHLLLIDTAWGERLTELLIEWVEAELQMPLARAIITHSHHDRIGGSAALERRGIPVLAHPLTRRLAAEQGLPVPDSIAGLDAPGSMTGVGAAEVFFPGPAHTRDNIMVWLEAHEILFGGCAVRSAAAGSLGNVAHADTVAWPHAIQRALERYPTAELVVPGHGAVGGRQLLEQTLSLFAR